MSKPSRIVLYLIISLFIMGSFVFPTNASIVTEDLKLLFNEVKKNFAELSGSVTPVLVNKESSSRSPYNNKLSTGQAASRRSGDLTKDQGKITSVLPRNDGVGKWNIFKQITANLDHTVQSNKQFNASLLDQVSSFVKSIFAPSEPIKEPDKVIVATPVPSLATDVNLKSSQDPQVLRRPNVDGNSGTSAVQRIIQPGAEQPQSNIAVLPSFLTALIADLQSQFNQYKQEQQKIISELVQVSNVGPRGSIQYTISNPTFTGRVTGLTDADIPDDISVQNYLPLTGGSISGNLTVSGALTGSGGSPLSLGDKLKVGTDTIIIDGVNNYITSPSNALSIYTTSTPWLYPPLPLLPPFRHT